MLSEGGEGHLQRPSRETMRGIEISDVMRLLLHAECLSFTEQKVGRTCICLVTASIITM